MQDRLPEAEAPQEVRNDRVIFARLHFWLEDVKRFWFAGFALVAAVAAVVLGSLLARACPQARALRP